MKPALGLAQAQGEGRVHIIQNGNGCIQKLVMENKVTVIRDSELHLIAVRIARQGGGLLRHIVINNMRMNHLHRAVYMEYGSSLYNILIGIYFLFGNKRGFGYQIVVPVGVPVKADPERGIQRGVAVRHRHASKAVIHNPHKLQPADFIEVRFFQHQASILFTVLRLKLSQRKRLLRLVGVGVLIPVIQLYPVDYS